MNTAGEDVRDILVAAHRLDAGAMTQHDLCQALPETPSGTIKNALRQLCSIGLVTYTVANYHRRCYRWAGVEGSA